MAPVDNETIGALLANVDKLIADGVQKIQLLISTPGGSVPHGLSAYNYLKGLPIELITVNFGSADSIGVILFCAGKVRLSVPNARFLLHGVHSQLAGGASLSEKQLDEIVKGLQIDTRNIAGVIAATTGKTEEEVYQAMLAGTTMNPDQAIKFGLVHRVETQLVPPGASTISIQK